MPVHWGKFMMANHDWDAPILEVSAAKRQGLPLLTPMIGEAVDLQNITAGAEWWGDLK